MWHLTWSALFYGLLVCQLPVNIAESQRSCTQGETFTWSKTFFEVAAIAVLR